ncbi:unnamed protein product [Larinioides sclopetarius]|uniref:Epidermal cell surface receptor n=1 Tax=Larinioides sclopetarius TaxID=280406 RepID=A0AAV2AMA2_9ARAC
MAMMRLWCFVALCTVLVMCEERLEDKMVEEDKGFGEENLNSYGGTVVDDKFSSRSPIVDAASEHSVTSVDANVTLMNDENSQSVTTVPTKDVTETETKPSMTVSNAPSAFTTHKVDPKKDAKKKNKLTFKKKDKHLDDEEAMEMHHDHKMKVMETTTNSKSVDTEAMTDSGTTVLTTHISSETTEEIHETTTAGKKFSEMPHTDLNTNTMRLARDESDITTEAAMLTMEGDMLNDKQETTPQTDLFETTMSPDVMHETIAETNSSQTTTNGPPMVETTLSPQEDAVTTTHPEVLIVTENNEPTTTAINTIPVDDGVTEVLMKSENFDKTEEHTVANEADHTFTTAEEEEMNSDHNNLNNDLSDEMTTVNTEIEIVSTTLPPASRKHKQMDLDNTEEPCLCDEPKVVANCVGGRTLPDPSCPCRAICARQSGESCSPGEPCDEEFGLRCSLQNSTCQGPLSIEVFDVTHNSAKVRWGSAESELQPQALVYYSSAFRGIHTQWNKVIGVKPVILENLLPGNTYYVKVEEDGKQEISSFTTKDNVMGNMPKILVKQRSQTTMTVVWDDFRLPSYHSEYILEYKPSGDSSQDWTKVQAGTQTIVTVTHLKPNTPYDMKVAVWEDDKLELPSEVITAYTADGCVKDNRMYNVGEEYFLECDARCVCNGNNETSCSPRCNAPYVKIGSKEADPLCYEKPLPSDPCCVTIRCTESKFYGDNGESKNKSGECPEIFEDSEAESKCLSDCDHDGDCSGNLKCCPSSCGGAVCVQPLMPEDVCEHIYCGPNAVCVSEKMACECAEGYEGNPHDFLTGCVLANATDDNSTEPQSSRSGFELNLDDNEHSEMKNHTTPIISEDQPNNSELRNELETENHDSAKEIIPTEAPFELDLSNKTAMPEEKDETTSAPEVPDDEENFHYRRPQDVGADEMKPDDEKTEEISGREMRNQTADAPMPFDGCEFNNVTYDRGVAFEDGCEARCTCEGRGHVSCVPRCTILSAGGPSCKEVQDPDDHCCKIMVCSFPGSTEKEEVDGLPVKIMSALAQNGTSIRVRIALSMSRLPAMVGRDLFEVWYRESSDSDNDLSQWNKKMITQNELTEVQQGVFEFDINDLMPQTDYFIKVGKVNQGSDTFNIAEFSNTVNVKTFPAAVKTVFQGCFHHNQSYSLGEIFYQGCEHKCICREKGFIECQDRCEIYIDTVGYEGCDWVPSEEDPCCTIPMCNRRKIPLMPDGRVPFTGAPENMCIVDHNEMYRVGDIWESGDGCKTKICRCTLLANGSTSIQCQSECPPLAPNAHIPTARCPHPVLIKPDGPCSCPYVVCNEPPRRVVQPPRPQCEFKGQRYDMGQEFHDGCIALCHCGQDLHVNCAPIECPYHFSAEFSNCLEWDIDPNFFPIPPHCCAPAKCKNDGSCMFSNRKFENFQVIPTELLPCGAGCVCVNGNVTCENRCPPIEDVPPVNLPCSPNLAFKGHPDGETCCLQWMCKEPLKTNYCMFQGSRYLVSEQWEVQKGTQQKLCSCRLNEVGSPEVECRGNCPQIPDRFLQPTEQCLRPVIVSPEDPLMCPYVVCNNTVSGHDLYNVNVVALNSTAVRVRFSLSNILVGLIGHAELHFTTDPTLPPSQWHIQKFSRPKRLFDSANIEYILNALRPNTTYFLQVKLKIDALQGGPQSELFKLTMPEEIIPTTTTTTTTTTTVPPMMMIDSKAEAHVIDSKTVRISWRNFEPQEKKYIYALQLKYKMKNEADDKWITTPMIHRDVTSYFLHDLEPSADYVVDVLFTPPKDLPTKIVSTKGLSFRTAEKMKEDYHLQVAVEDNKVETDKSSFSFAGIPEPITKYVHVIKIMYKSNDGEQSYSFKVPKSNHIMLDHLKPGKKYLAQLELYLTNGQTLTSNEVEFITKPAKSGTNVSVSDNVISHESHGNGKQAELLQSKDGTEEENKAYFIALVVVAVVAAVAAFGFILLLILLVRRQASAKAPISRTPSESAYDNPTYKFINMFQTYDGERPEDKTNGQTIQTTQA